MIIIPDRESKKLVQINRGNVLGQLWATMGIDFQDNPGAIRLGNRMKINTSAVSNQGLSVGFELFDGRMWTVAGTRVFKNTSNSLITQFVEDASSGAVTTYDADYSDIIVFNSTLVASIGGTKIYSKAADGSGTGTWTDRSGSLATVTTHMMVYFKKFDRLYITNGQKVHSSDTSWTIQSSTGNYYIDLSNSSGNSISCIATSKESIWLGMNRGPTTTDDLIRDCSVFQWDGVSPQAFEYKIPASGVMSIVIKNDIPHVLDSNGILRAFNGTEFKEVARLPVGKGFLSFVTNTGNSTRFIHPKGMCVTENDTILMLICNRNVYLSGSTENINETLPSGIWEYDPITKDIKHKNPITAMSMSSTSVTDYGQNRLNAVGALTHAKIPDSSSSGMSSIICGATYYTNASSTATGIFIDAPFPSNNATLPEGQKAGYFVTSWMQCGTGLQVPSIKDIWQKIFLHYKQLLAANDKIVVKYRTREAVATEISITWLNTTSFSTTTDLSALVGYEIEILQGTGSGKCVHISSVTGSGTFTVNLDDTVTGVTNGTATARYQNWTKAFTINNQVDESTIQNLVSVISTRIQIKVYMEFTGDDEIYELGIINQANQEAK